MHSIPANWWIIPARPEPGAYAGSAETSFTRLQTSKDHFNTIVLTHLPYILHASTTPSNVKYAYSRGAAVAASREVLLRFPSFQQYKHVPASYRALEHKCFIAGFVLLFAHMHSHSSGELDAIDHERPRDLIILSAAVESMRDIFAKDRDDPGSECARLLTRLMDVEQQAATGVAWRVSCSYEEEGEAFAMDESSELAIQLPYSGTVSIQRAVDLIGGEASQIGGTSPNLYACQEDNSSYS